MSSRYYGHRPRELRYGRASRDVQQGDAIVVALTIQIFICVTLFLAAGIFGRVDREGFERVRDQYRSMATDESQNQQLAAMFGQLTDGSRGMLSAISEMVSHWMEAISDGVSEPIEPVEPSQADTSGDGKFDYDYLKPIGAAGGWLPADAGDELTRQLSPPRGSTLSPVALGGAMMAPVEGIITSLFAYRYHPLTETADFHTGLDIAAEEGRSILAALPGEVVEVGWSDIYGNYIVLQHATHLQTSYSHCSEIIAREGMAVRQGERIAKVGQTGTVTGPHLHFSVIVDGMFTDPAWVLEDNIRVVE